MQDDTITRDTTPHAIQPVPYDPAFEKLEADEANTTDELLETLRDIRETTFEDGGRAMRSVHVKSHALLKGEFQVLNNLPAYLAQGLFAMPGNHPVIMRLSTTPGDIMPDSISTPRGCALKIMNVTGERLPGSEEDTTQDFVMVNNDTFFQVSSLKAFSKNLKLLAATTDKATGAKIVLSTMMRGMEKAIEAMGGMSAKIKNMGGEPEKHLLGESFFTQVPILYGPYMAKIGLVPVSPELTALTGQMLNIHDDPNTLRDAARAHFRTHGGTWELRIQLCTDIEKMPLEDAAAVWPEDESPYIVVARIVMPPQDAWNDSDAEQTEDSLTFSPWCGLQAHRPLGAIMRARKPAYEESARFRGLRNHMSQQDMRSGGCPFSKQ